ncbi:Ff.00g039410.m01.CDS01 [Fusarium sp. VM40]|nr:Ff.00g039410.m01.CDS01 [Fusarium sp. VM40]
MGSASEPIAVVGMAINVAGADDVPAFSQMLRTGKSQHQVIGPDRLMFDTLFRENDKDPSRNWYGNFIQDVDAFDHKFFKRSPRESTTMDPQQRLFLQAAYQAVEQSGYFSELDEGHGDRDKKHVGVYLGACAGDYEHHVACHSANAFTATGNLKSFIPGKVSHYFGWTGPSMTFDTACSASAVAIHTACNNLRSGECSAALAGGVSTISNFLWFQNLAGASFLSPSGQCKPFDDSADGYCRAEGIACVFLKRLSDAIADGNPIFGCVASTAVYQNQNCTPLFVPNSPSLSQLFSDVITKANLKPSDISLVEAHGTGTPVGDPAEYDSIRLAIGGSNRNTVLPIGSVKGHIGHAEGASGVISLIKILVMMQESYIPPQASFSKMSGHIKVTPSDLMEVTTSLREWTADQKAALINNYGASGSNASMVVVQPPGQRALEDSQRRSTTSRAIPFRISGHDGRAIASYCAKLAQTLEQRPYASIADIAFNVNRQFNPSLARRLVFSSRSITDLKSKLSEIDAAPEKANVGTANSSTERPVILCFGGQVSTYVGLDRAVYDSMSISRHHLDQCDSEMQYFGFGSMYPDIFMRTPQDTVKLQMMLFALQYSCAMAWLDSGLSTQVAAVTGHSFGEITALCVSGALKLQDAIKLVVSRARLVRDNWGLDPGAMMAVESDEAHVLELLAEANQPGDDAKLAEIACYNGPRSFTIAGSRGAVERVAEVISRHPRFSSIRSKWLNVTNAFHSSLVDPITLELEKIGNDLEFKEPTIPLERATRTRTTSKPGPKFVAEHMRNPVYFNDAIQRLAQDHPTALFLEAGSSSTITIMANRALASQAASKSNYFQAVNILTDKGLDNLTDVTLGLWSEGLNVNFWGHNRLQASEFTTMMLPPYQFEKSRHWLELKSPLKAIEAAASELASSAPINSSGDREAETKPDGLWSLVSAEADNALFRINTYSTAYKNFLSGHLIAQTAPICPATLMVDMAIEALFSINPEWKQSGLVPVIHNMVNHAPLCIDPSLTTYLAFEKHDNQITHWTWRIYSQEAEQAHSETHVEAEIHFRDPSEKSYQSEFSRFERLVSHAKCTDMLQLGLGGEHQGDVLTGRSIYRTFADVVDYGDMYRGVKAVVGGSNECTGHVSKQRSNETWLEVPLSDSFSQVSGIWVNCMNDFDSNDMFIATGCELSMRSPFVDKEADQIQENWHVFARHTRQSEKLYMSDVFVFNASTGMLREVMLGIQYARVAKASMRRMLTRLTNDPSVLKATPSSTAAPKLTPTEGLTTPIDVLKPTVSQVQKVEPAKPKQSSHPDITEDVKNLVAHVAGIEVDEITLDAEMADFGIDSLMGMEVAREVQVVFKCTLDQNELMEATSLRKFVVCISKALYGPDYESAAIADDNGNSSTASSSDVSENSGSATPPSPLASSVEQSPPKAFSSLEPQAVEGKLELLQSEILESFGQVKLLCDQHLRDFKVDNIDRVVLAGSSRLCVALVVEAFEQLGVSLSSAQPGQVLARIRFQPAHQRLVDFIYRFLEHDARLVDIDKATGQITRTRVPTPRKSSSQILDEQLASYPEFVVANKLTYYAGTHLAPVLSGETDGLRVIFGSIQGRELVQALYCEHTFNRMNYNHMRLVIENLVQKFSQRQPGKTLKILEVGAGTGGTTYVLAPVLAKLNIPVEYIFTDISGSMVANARRKFGKLYPFMQFAVHDIEKPPAEELKGQHIIIGSNAVHATRNLVTSASNLRSALRPDGFLMMLEMTESVPFVDIIFGLLEGWWLFDDGRNHAIIAAEEWERNLHDAGFGHVDWTDGSLPENTFQKVIIALASGEPQARIQKSTLPDVMSALPEPLSENKKAEVEAHVVKHTAGFTVPDKGQRRSYNDTKAVVILTGATGSLGSHLASSLTRRDDVGTVVCINRRSRAPVHDRQDEAFSSRGISMSSTQRSKLRVLEADTPSQNLGLSASDYEWLVQNGTHIVHNAWPMSGTRPVKAFEPQFQSLRNLLNLARDMSCRDNAPRITFQLVSSIGVVGHHESSRVPEQRVPLEAALPIGYCEAKWVCERMLDETLHRYPDAFRTMVVRPGQIAGSSSSGFWNPIEHFAFLVKSAQSLGAWPNFDGILQWVPVDVVADTMVDLLHIGDRNAPTPYPVYHIDNPVGQPWSTMSKVLADALNIPPQQIIPFNRWIKLVRNSPLPADTWNPAARLVDFLDSNFERMSCGGLILDTEKTQEHSQTLASQGPVTAEVARRYVASWKTTGFLDA